MNSNLKETSYLTLEARTISGSVQGPLSWSKHPPVAGQVHVPPKKSGKLLQKGAIIQAAKDAKVADDFMHFYLGSTASNNVLR